MSSKSVVLDRRRKAGADPTRLRMIERFREDRDWTAKELGAALDILPNSLYHHLRVLEEAGLIARAGTRAPGRMVETTYRQATGLSERLPWQYDDDLALLFAALLEAAKTDVQRAVHETGRREAAGEVLAWESVMVESPSFETTSDEVAEFHHRLLALIAEFRARAATQHRKGSPPATLKLTYALREHPSTVMTE